MPLSLQVMALLGLLSAIVGLPMLADPAGLRRRMRWRETPQSVYILRIVGTMFAAMGLILIVFAFSYWHWAE